MAKRDDVAARGLRIGRVVTVSLLLAATTVCRSTAPKSESLSIVPASSAQAVVGLGFGIPLAAVARAGLAGIGYTAAGIAFALTLGVLLGRWLRIERETSLLITVGTSICGDRCR